jgi:putative membrane protein insertion efficiency factor
MRIDYLIEFPKLVVLKMIKIYQRTLSFDHGVFKFMFPGGYCKFRPSCSEYTYQAIAKYGLWRGGLKGAWRLLRCNPWSKGGEDEVK